MSMEEKTASQVSDFAGNEQREEVSKRVDEKEQNPTGETMSIEEKTASQVSDFAGNEQREEVSKRVDEKEQNPTGETMSIEEKTASQVSDFAGNEEREEVSKRVDEKEQNPTGETMSMEEKTASQVTDFSGNEEGEEVSKRVDEKEQNPTGETMSTEEKTKSQVPDSAGNEEGEEVSKMVDEKEAISETENEGGDNGSEYEESEESAEEDEEETEAVRVPVKRRRGIPRKNIANGEQKVPVTSPQAGFLTSPFRDTLKRSRGRPRGTGRLQFLASLGGGIAMETAGGNFTPHVLTLQVGEDIVSKVSWFSLRGPRAVCILSATGLVSTVVIRKPGTLNTVLKYEGLFEILTLSGSFLYSGEEVKHRKRGEVNVSLAKSDGGVFGGELAGSMIAASPVQLVLGSFKQNITNEINKWHNAPVLRIQGDLGLLGQEGQRSDAEKKDGNGEVDSQDLANITPNPKPMDIELNGDPTSL